MKDESRRTEMTDGESHEDAGKAAAGDLQAALTSRLFTKC
jgi:hypothetical protein